MEREIGAARGTAHGGSVPAAAASRYCRVNGAKQMGDEHASQQLAWSPTRARPPRGALHFAAPCLMEHFVTPFALLRQQVTNPGFPHVDLAAHCTMAPREAFGLPFTACATHRTYAP